MIPRIVFAGGPNVGKTSLITYCVEEHVISPSRAFDYSIVDEHLTNYATYVDTSGQVEHWGTIHREIMAADMVVFVFDITSHQSLENIGELASYYGPQLTVPIVICANKVESHMFSYERHELDEIAAKFKRCQVLLTSPISGSGCSFLLEYIKTGSHRSSTDLSKYDDDSCSLNRDDSSSSLESSPSPLSVYSGATSPRLARNFIASKSEALARASAGSHIGSSHLLPLGNQISSGSLQPLSTSSSVGELENSKSTNDGKRARSFTNTSGESRRAFSYINQNGENKREQSFASDNSSSAAAAASPGSSPRGTKPTISPRRLAEKCVLQ